MLMEVLREEGFANLVDFVYVPTCFERHVNFGYAFVNLITHQEADRCRDRFQNFTRWPVDSEKGCEVGIGDFCQGLDAHFERSLNSPVMHETVSDEFRPAIYKNGERHRFPSPTPAVRLPRA